MTHTRMCQECPVSIEKLSFFFIQVKTIQVLVFDNWHPLNIMVLTGQLARGRYLDTRKFITSWHGLINLYGHVIYPPV